MGQERRRHSRSELPGKVQLKHPQRGELVFTIRNLSDGGLLLEATREDSPAIGAVVEVRILGLEEAGPAMRMQVIRIDSQGLALKYM